MSEANSRKCKLLKKFDTESFGFQVNGKTNLKGNHAVSLVSKNSCADLAGLKLNDKIISVNGQSVGDYTIDQLIKLIEIETLRNPTCLDLVVSANEIIEISDDEQEDKTITTTRKRCNLSIKFNN